MTRIRVCLLLLSAAVLFTGLFVYGVRGRRSKEHAMERARQYAEAVNKDFEHPERIYAMLDEHFRSRMSEEAFCEAFRKERSYPYITPLYLFDPEIKQISETQYRVTFAQAARIVGMTYQIDLVYENGDYYVRDWEQFLDGSYLDKFKDIPYSLDWYYD